MLTVVVLSSDSKLAAQIELWCRQSLADRLRVESYKSLDAYKEMLENAHDPALGPQAVKPAAPGAPAAAPAPAPADGAKAEEPKKFKLFIIDGDLIAAKPVQWITELQNVTKEKAGFLVKEGTPKILLMNYEGGVHRNEALQNDTIDDVILKPIDKTLLLQKTEFLTAEDGKINPTFLFRAKTAQIIEVGRDVMIDEVSEFAVSVRSPGPVPEGAFASIHADVFGARGSRRMIGRVYESIKHPVREGEYLVRFSYFGITAEQLSTVRRFIKANQTQMRVKTWGAPTTASHSVGATSHSAAAAGATAAAGVAAKPGLSKELAEKMALLKMRKFAIIDLNPDTLAEAKATLETSFKGMVVRTFPSYIRLLADLKKFVPDAPRAGAPGAAPGATANAAPAKPAPAAASPGGTDKGAIPLDQAFPGGKKLAVVLRGKSHDLVRFEPLLKKSDIVLGKTSSEWLEKPDQWTNSIDRDDKEAYEEFLSFVEAGTSGKLAFRLTDAAGRTVYLEASGQLEKAGADDGASLVRIEMVEIDADTFNKAIAVASGGVVAKDPSIYRFEAILIDGSFLRPDPTVWHEKFVELLRAAKVLGPDDQPPKIFVISDPKSRARLEDFRIKGIHDFNTKPMDRRYLVEKFKAFNTGVVAVREADHPPFVPCEIPAKLGKEVTMEELAEYGVQIIHPTAFREKTFMRFFSRLFGEEGEWVSGKCHSCEKIADSESFRCQFMFSAPSDDLLQRIRRWIREDYVAKKEGAGKT